ELRDHAVPRERLDDVAALVAVLLVVARDLAGLDLEERRLRVLPRDAVEDEDGALPREGRLADLLLALLEHAGRAQGLRRRELERARRRAGRDVERELARPLGLVAAPRVEQRLAGDRRRPELELEGEVIEVLVLVLDRGGARLRLRALGEGDRV